MMNNIYYYLGFGLFWLVLGFMTLFALDLIWRFSKKFRIQARERFHYHTKAVFWKMKTLENYHKLHTENRKQLVYMLTKDSEQGIRNRKYACMILKRYRKLFRTIPNKPKPIAN